MHGGGLVTLAGHRSAIQELLRWGGYWGHRDHRFNVRAALRFAQGHVCPLCGNPMRTGNVDHVLAKARGGYDGMGNLLATHEGCNRVKADRLPTGCELIWLVGVCAKLGVPMELREGVRWAPPPPQIIFNKMCYTLLAKPD